MSVNKVILVGHLGADPETKTTGSGTVVAQLRLATSERVKRNDQWEDHTEWHRIAAFGRTAENAAKYLTKGRQIYVEGKIRTKKWTDQDGNDRYSTEVIADVIHFLGSGNGNGQRNNGGQRDGGSYGGGGNTGGGRRETYDGAAAASGDRDYPSNTDSGGDDDIPF